MTLGGRAAEELVFNEVTTGAANDLEKVTSTAKQMIMRYGMSEKLGPRVLGRNQDMPFLGREMGAEPDYSEEIAREIDDEIRRVIEEGHVAGPPRARGAHRRPAPALGDPDRARDDRQGPVRPPPEGESEEVVFGEEPARPGRGGCRRGEEAARTEAAAVPAARGDDAAASARRREELVPHRRRTSAARANSARFSSVIGAPRATSVSPGGGLAGLPQHTRQLCRTCAARRRRLPARRPARPSRLRRRPSGGAPRRRDRGDARAPAQGGGNRLAA